MSPAFLILEALFVHSIALVACPASDSHSGSFLKLHIDTTQAICRVSIVELSNFNEIDGLLYFKQVGVAGTDQRLDAPPAIRRLILNELCSAKGALDAAGPHQLSDTLPVQRMRARQNTHMRVLSLMADGTDIGTLHLSLYIIYRIVCCFIGRNVRHRQRLSQIQQSFWGDNCCHEKKCWLKYHSYIYTSLLTTHSTSSPYLTPVIRILPKSLFPTAAVCSIISVIHISIILFLQFLIQVIIKYLFSDFEPTTYQRTSIIANKSKRSTHPTKYFMMFQLRLIFITIRGDVVVPWQSRHYNISMRIEIRLIMSMRLHGASCHLLILDNRTHILLDCGINANFDFSQYRANEKIISKVEIVLLTHPSLEYLGALPFILEQFHISPRVYATQPIIILGPLNIHQAMLNQRYQKYNTEVLRRIYTRFESVISVKPLQRKRFELEPGTGLARPQKEGDNPHHHSIHLICYQSGSEMGGVCWRISYCMFSCVYLVGYSNYKQFHLEGMDLDSLIARKTDILITDCYNDREQKGIIRRQAMKDQLEKIIQAQMKYPDGRKLIFCCSPNERMVELMSMLTILSSDKVFDGRVDMVHYSSSYQQLIRSQTDYKITEETNNDDDEEQKVIQPPIQQTIFDKDFNFNKKIQNRICITTAGACRPDALLWTELLKLGEQSKLIHVGQDRIMRSYQQGKPLDDLQAIFSQPVVKSQSIIPQEKALEPQPQVPPQIKFEPKNIMSGQYIHCFGFPRFVGRHNQHPQHDAYGEHYESDNNMYGSMEMEKDPLDLLPKPQVKKKKINVDNHHVQFKLPPPTNIEHLKMAHGKIEMNDHTTTFESSLQIINLLNAEKVILVNGSAAEYEVYQRAILQQRGRTVALREDPLSLARKFEIFGFQQKKYVVFENNNQTIEQNLNLFSEELVPHGDIGGKNILKVDGKVVLRPNNTIDIVLVESGERELMEFNMAEFYRSVKGEHCRFTDNGVLEINDIKLYRRKNEITIEGTYSMEYFRLRELLYRYVQMSSG